MHCRTEQRRLPLRRPFSASGWTLTHRDIVLFSVTDEASGLTGWGEAAPFPAFGTEDLPVCMAALERAREMCSSIRESPLLVKASAGGSEVLERTDFAAMLCSLGETPAARFAVESAVLDLAARLAGLRLSDVLGGTHLRRIPLNAVLGSMSPEAAAEAAMRAWDEGFTCLKLKVGGASLDDDIARIRAVRLAVPGEMRLRLDANGAWDFTEAEQAMHEFVFYDIEYIEQPVPAGDIDELAALTQLAILPVAADESAQDLAKARILLDREAVDLFVIKPMAAGSLVEARRFAIEAGRRGREVVFTSLIDSSVGRHAVAQLCASLPFAARHQGLATGALFLEDTYRDDISEGAFILPEAPGLGFDPQGGDSHHAGRVESRRGRNVSGADG